MTQCSVQPAGAGVVFDLFSVGALVASSVQFQTDSAAFMEVSH